jgi:hypothetical protein
LLKPCLAVDSDVLATSFAAKAEMERPNLPQWIMEPHVDSTAMLMAAMTFRARHRNLWDSMELEDQLTIVDHVPSFGEFPPSDGFKNVPCPRFLAARLRVSLVLILLGGGVHGESARRLLEARWLCSRPGYILHRWRSIPGGSYHGLRQLAWGGAMTARLVKPFACCWRRVLM